VSEPHCLTCGLVDRQVCRSPEQAENCPHAPVEGKAPRIAEGPLAGLRRGHYGAILADPPWSFLTRSDKGKDRSPEQHYNCMSLAEIKALPVRELAAKDCALFIWTIDTHVAMALDVITAWGFTYKTRAFVWAKTNRGGGDLPAADDKAWFKGMGFWSRANPEDCLLATTGAPQRQNKAVRRLLVAERREHSRKPEETYGRIEALVPGPYVELFSRSRRDGWDAMGNEVGKFQSAETTLRDLEDLL
jgi:N6-adenosine-specific RNA methylase IME4